MSREKIVPLYVFDSAAEYHRRHHSGVQQEFLNESTEVEKFNERQYKFKTWVLAKLYQAGGCNFWVFFVRADGVGDYLFPREGETCDLTLWNKAGKTKRWEKPWIAERIENPAATFGIPDGPIHRLPAFKVRVPFSVPDDIVRPMEDDPDEVGYNAPSRVMGKHAFGDKKAYQSTLMLRISTGTKDAELGALDKLYHNPEDVLTAKQKAAFEFLLGFKAVPFVVNLFDHFPHLLDPMNNPGGMPPKVITMLKGFDMHQRTAYKTVLSKLPCGVCVIPGGPGAGKTHWNLVLTAAIQSKSFISYGPNNTPSSRSAKVLYILDINKPLDDTCNKIVKLYKSLGMVKKAVRLHGWHYFEKGRDEKKVLDFTQKFLLIARMNRYRRQNLNEGCLAPSLDELAVNIYEQYQGTQYRELHAAMGGGRSTRLSELVMKLYQDVLAQVDFIATTPVPAATAFNGMFKPEIVIFDESPHAREASTMVAIAQYDPIAWIFSGDHRQTRPFIASDDVRDNKWAPQMLVSMMERADRANAIEHSLLINHRAYGGLQELASEMFYAKKMISGHKPSELFPPSVQHVQRFLERFLQPGQKCKQPRLVAFNGRSCEQRVGTSWYNQSHIDWVMERVVELLPDTMFRQVGKNERGTILIISPYKESYMKYKRAIRDLPETWQARLNVEARCEARTIDTCQGGEADIVFLDMVRSDATDFTDDPNRLNVAITRARQGEIIMMHPGMVRSARFLKGIFKYCEAMRQVVDISIHGQPQKLVQVPNEEQAYKNHLLHEAQLDPQRVAHGLEPVTIEAQLAVIAPMADVKSDGAGTVDDDPPSIFAEKFARLAANMREIIEQNKIDREKKPSKDEVEFGSNKIVSCQPQSVSSPAQPQSADQNDVQALPTQTMSSTLSAHHNQEQCQVQPGSKSAAYAGSAIGTDIALPGKCALSLLTDAMSGLYISSKNRHSGAAPGSNMEKLTELSKEDQAASQRQTQSQDTSKERVRANSGRGLAQSRWNISANGTTAVAASNGGHGVTQGAPVNSTTNEMQATQATFTATRGLGASGDRAPEIKKNPTTLTSGSTWW